MSGNDQINIMPTEEVVITLNGRRIVGSAEVLLCLQKHPRLIINGSLRGKNRLLLDSNPKAHPFIRFRNSGLKGRIMTLSLGPDKNQTERCEFCFKNGNVELGDRHVQEISFVTFKIFNFPNFYSNGDRFHDNHWVESGNSRKLLGGTTLEGGKWTIQLRALENIDETIESLEGRGYGLTHEGRIESHDGSPFNGKSVKEVIDTLSDFLSFVRGMWVAPIDIQAFSTNGTASWKDMTLRYSSEWKYVKSWFDEKNGQLMKDIFPGFWALTQDRVWSKRIKEVIYWYVLSNESGNDLGLLSTQTALELLSWTCVTRKRRRFTGKEFKTWQASKKIRELLTIVGIDTAIPSCLKKMTEAQKRFRFEDGPHAFTEIRNEITHPEHRNKGNFNRLKYEAWNLGQWYLELILLWLMNLNTSFSCRLGFQRQGLLVQVPWINKKQNKKTCCRPQ